MFQVKMYFIFFVYCEMFELILVDDIFPFLKGSAGENQLRGEKGINRILIRFYSFNSFFDQIFAFRALCR